MREAFEATRIVVLSGEEDPRQVRRAIEAGAAGFIPKSSTPEVLLSALRLVLADGVYLPAVALKGVAGEGSGAAISTDRLDDALSERQGQLQGLIRNSNVVFQTTADRDEELRQIFQIFPTFLEESRLTLNRLETFAADTDPLMVQLIPAARQLSGAVAKTVV